MDENALIKAAQGGDAAAFEQLLEARYDTIFRFAMTWCGNRDDAEDVAQQACIKLARSLVQFKFESAFSTWLYRLVINCAKDWQRSQRTRAEAPEDDSPAVAEHSAESAIYLRQVLAWVEKLGEDVKETLVLVFGEGLSHGEVADILNVKESTISWRIHNVRKKLSLLRKEEGGVL